MLKLLKYAAMGLVAYEIYLHTQGRCFYDEYLDPQRQRLN